MTEVKIPERGESIERAEVAKVLVSEGDTVDVDQPILELESDKASLELPSPTAGTVRQILVHEGDEVEIGQTVLTLGEDEQPRANAEPEPRPATDVGERPRTASETRRQEREREAL